MREMQKVLIVKLGAIGDVVMTLPLLKALKEKEDVHVTWMCGEAPKQLLEKMGLVDRLLVVDEKKLLKGSFFQKCLFVWGVWKKLKCARFDLIIVAHADPRYRLLTFFNRGEKRFFRPQKGIYHAKEYLKLGGEEDSISYPQMFSNPKEHFIAIAPGGAKNVLADDMLRRWPMTHYRALIELLTQKGYKVVVTGAETDTWCLPYLEGLAFENLIGKKNLIELIEVYSKASCLITHDSGPFHLAKIAGCPCLGLFGPTNPLERTSNNFFIWGGENLPCRPCYDGKKFAPCQNNLCLKRISPQQVFEKILTII